MAKSSVCLPLVYREIKIFVAYKKFIQNDEKYDLYKTQKNWSFLPRQDLLTHFLLPLKMGLMQCCADLECFLLEQRPRIFLCMN